MGDTRKFYFDWLTIDDLLEEFENEINIIS